MHKTLDISLDKARTPEITQSSMDIQWGLSLFGTAVGAGILFLPLQVAGGGLFPLVLLTLIVGPITFLSHRNMVRITLAGKTKGSDFTATIYQNFGPRLSGLLTFLYFAAFFTPILIYGTSLTNMASATLASIQNAPELPRGLLSLGLIVTLTGIIAAGERAMLKIANALVIPLITTLLAVSIYLIPQWNLSLLSAPIDWSSSFKTAFLALPALIFSFEFAGACSAFAMAYRRRYQQAKEREKRTSSILLFNTSILVIFTMFFVFSCLLTLTPNEISQAKAANIPVLSIFAHKYHDSFFGTVASTIAITAICTSFLGNFLAAREGLNRILHRYLSRYFTIGTAQNRSINRITEILLTITIWLVSWSNLNISDMIGSIVAPVTIAIQFIFPVYAFTKIPSLYHHRSISNLFVLAIGVLTVISHLGFINF